MSCGDKLRVAVIADELTRACLAHECRLRDVTSLNYRWLLRFWRPDMLFVESAWQGHRGAWKFGVAAYPDHPRRNNRRLAKVVAYARELGIPTVFWNKEDGVHFERFIDSARLFEHVFTVDSLCVPRYRAVLDAGVSVTPLPFAAQPASHYFDGFHFTQYRANFVGSYSHHIHDRRRAWQDMLFGAADGLGVTVFDRNSGRKSAIYRYPDSPNLAVRAAVPHGATAAVYRDYLVSLNVNTVEDSPTMFSRRLVEILACGGIAVTTPALSVERLFAECCYVVHEEGQARELFERLRYGPSDDDLARARAGAELILREHTWAQRWAAVREVVGV